MTTFEKVLLGLVLVAGAIAGVEWRRAQDASHAADEHAVAPAKAAAAIAQARVETVTVQLAGKRDTVLRRIHDTLPVPQRLLQPITQRDTSDALAALPRVVAERDSLARSCTEYVFTADRYRSACEVQHAADRKVITDLEAVVRSRPPRRSWRLGITGGYGALLSGDRVLTGPSLTAGVTWSPF